MSYILEALKKSEQDRGNGAIPSVQSIHSSSINYHHTSNSIWPWIIGIILIINVLALLYFFSIKSPIYADASTEAAVIPQNSSELSRNLAVHNPPEPQTTSANITSTSKKEFASTEITRETTPVEKTQNLYEETLPKQQQVETNIAYNTNTIARRKTQPARQSNVYEEPIKHQAEVMDFHDLPDNIKQQIPEMIFSAHVYSSNVLQRSLVINGNFMEEGEQLNDNLTLSEITPKGAIFTFKDYRFSTSVIAGWN